MKRLLLLAVALTAMAALLFGASPASSDSGLQAANLSCNDGTNLGLTLDATSLTGLTDAVSAVNLNPVGDPALGCSLTQTAPSSAGSGNPQHEYVVGGGQAVATEGFNPFIAVNCTATAPCSFSLEAHAPIAAPGVPSPVTGGTMNLNQTGTGSFVAKPDCMQAGGEGPGTAQTTGKVTHATGAFTGLIGHEVQWDMLDSGVPGGTGDRIGFYTTSFPPNTPCGFDGYLPYASVTNGNINVHGAT